MNYRLTWLKGGGVTSPRGFKAGAVYAGIKTYGEEPRLDLGLLVSSCPASAAAVFTRNRVVGAPVTVSREHVKDGVLQAIIVNSGISNVAMGEVGLADARRMAELAAQHARVRPEDVLVGSTGVIGRRLPLDKVAAKLAEMTLSSDGGPAFARAMMTTDTVAKEAAVRIDVGTATYTVGGAAKGAGMAHPDLATVFCFLTTDAPCEKVWLREALRRVADVSLNMVDIDMDTSTSDTMAVLANGEAGGDLIGAEHPAADAVEAGLRAVAIELARALARDGEGARTLIEVNVIGARTESDARVAARTIVSSPLVKTMITGRDANLGRVLMALGRSGAEIELERTSVSIGGLAAFAGGKPTELDYARISAAMNAPEVTIDVDLGLGEGRATAWGCDLTEEYVRVNAHYTT